MNFRMMKRRIHMVLALLAMGLLLTACSGKAPVKDDPIADQGIIVEEDVSTIQEPVVSEEVEEIVEIQPDYAAMAPAEYGVGDIFFAFDKYDLDREAMSILSANARALREADVVVMISGHCDERGTVEYNMALGEKRALAVRDYLVSLGVPARNLRTTSYGKSKPFAWGHNEAAWAKNRRAHFERP